ncbi:MAG: hypothetical protein FE044_04065 [Thermoplasmata archaeon]|nr:MAG: hypothetical protein FE044_04065 [Thermoplasmata archaeon]
MNIVVKDAETGNRITMQVDDDNTIEEIIEEVANYWKKDAGAYVIKDMERKYCRLKAVLKKLAYRIMMLLS